MPAAWRITLLVPEPPFRRRRPHECLVVEASGSEPRREIVDRADIEAHGWPAVLARRDEPGAELLRGRSNIRLGARADAELDERVGLVDPGADDAARPVIFEAAADEVHAVGEQRCGQGVAREAFVADAVELEAQGLRAIDDSATGQSAGLRHGAARGSGAPGSALARMSWVRVSRLSLNHCRQPALWAHHSTCGPIGLSRT